eukprot:1179387-Prorocentrum_minimum.AAC.1
MCESTPETVNSPAETVNSPRVSRRVSRRAQPPAPAPTPTPRAAQRRDWCPLRVYSLSLSATGTPQEAAPLRGWTCLGANSPPAMS